LSFTAGILLNFKSEFWKLFKDFKQFPREKKHLCYLSLTCGDAQSFSAALLGQEAFAYPELPTVGFKLNF